MNLLALQSGNLITASTVALKEYPVHETCIHTWYVPQFLLFPHMELSLMFHTLWTNSSCHGYHSLEFPVSWVIKFPTVILLYWFVSVTPYFLGLLSLRTFRRILGSPQAFAFCTPVSGKNWVFCTRCVEQQETEQSEAPLGALWAPGSAVDATSACWSLCCWKSPASVSSPLQHLHSFSAAVFPPATLSRCCECTSSCPVCRRCAEQLHLFSPGAWCW